MPQYRDIAVSLYTRDPAGTQLLEEYGVTIDESTRTVTCWISSEERKEFVISAMNQSHTQAIRCLTSIDGRSVDHALWRPQEFGSIEGAYVSEDTMVPFVFAPIQVTDEEDVLHGPPDLEALGTIRIVVLRCTVAVEGLNYAQREDEFDLHDIGPVHERAKKLGGHCVSLGDETHTAPALTALTHDIDRVDAPHCVFVFRYRPRDLLQAQGIIPHRHQHPGIAGPSRDMKPQTRHSSGSTLKRAREPTNPPAHEHRRVKREAHDDHSALAAEEGRIAAQLEAVRARMARLPHDASSSVYTPKRVKREPGPSILPGPSGRGKGRPEVIDLTIDD